MSVETFRNMIDNQINLQLENLHLKEALQFANRGWEDALSLLNKDSDIASGHRNEEATLEIESLQMELNAVHKSLLQRSQSLEKFNIRLMNTTNTLVTKTEELREFVKCPMIEKQSYDDYDDSQETSLDDSELQMNAYLSKIENTVDLIDNIQSFIATSSEPYDNKETEEPEEPEEHIQKNKKKTVKRRISQASHASKTK